MTPGGRGIVSFYCRSRRHSTRVIDDGNNTISVTSQHRHQSQKAAMAGKARGRILSMAREIGIDDRPAFKKHCVTVKFYVLFFKNRTKLANHITPAFLKNPTSTSSVPRTAPLPCWWFYCSNFIIRAQWGS